MYKLDWNKDYHVGFEWLPDIDDEGGMRVEVECFWGDLVPAYQEVVHYSPNWVTWANKERGLVGVVKHVDVEKDTSNGKTNCRPETLNWRINPSL